MGRILDFSLNDLHAIFPRALLIRDIEVLSLRPFAQESSYDLLFESYQRAILAFSSL